MKLKKGKFLKEYIPYYDNYDSQPIGAHSAEARIRRENSKKVYVAYYYIDENKYQYIVKNPSAKEKLLASTISGPVLKFAGYIDQCTIVNTTKDLKEQIQKNNKYIKASKQSKDDGLSL